MEQVCSNVFSSVGRCVQKDGTRFLCDITELLGMLWSAWMPGIPRVCCGKEPKGGVEEKERSLPHSALSLAIQIALGK